MENEYDFNFCPIFSKTSILLFLRRKYDCPEFGKFESMEEKLWRGVGRCAPQNVIAQVMWGRKTQFAWSRQSFSFLRYLLSNIITLELKEVLTINITPAE